MYRQQYSYHIYKKSITLRHHSQSGAAVAAAAPPPPRPQARPPCARALAHGLGVVLGAEQALPGPGVRLGWEK